MKAHERLIRPLTAAALAVGVAILVFAACSGRGSQPEGLVNQPQWLVNLQAAEPPQSVTDALAELDALPCPAGVDGALWGELKEALEAALLSREESRFSNRDSLSTESRLESRDSGGGEKIASTPPTGEANRVNDFGLADHGDGTYTLSWHYRNLGDYAQDGVVAISDITPIAQHFGETYNAETEPDCIQAVIDGSGNGKVDIADVTPIAQCFGIEVADYLLEGATALEGPFSEVEAVPVESAIGADGGRAHFAHVFTPGEYSYFRVAARDAAGTPGEPSNTVGLALQILSVTPTEVKEGTVVTFSAEVLGAGPLSYEWDFGGGAQYETYTEPSPRVVLTRETGEFPASLTVANPVGAATFPFTLSKLAREWKYETLTSGFSVIDASLTWAAGKLWAYVRESSMDPLLVKGYLYSGHPGDWEMEEVEYSRYLAVNSRGEPAFAGYYGNFFEEDLCYAQKVNGQWLFETVEERPFIKGCDLVFAAGEVPFIAYVYRRFEPVEVDELRYARRVDGVWEKGLLDNGSGGYVRMAVDCAGEPAACYGTGGCLWWARWNTFEEMWDKEIVEEPATDDWGVGGFPVLGFDGENRPVIAFTNVLYGGEYNGYVDERYLIYAVRESDGWHKEVVRTAVSSDFFAAGLAHDPLGQPILMVTYPYPRDEFEFLWHDGAEWVQCAWPEAFTAYSATRLQVSPDGTPAVMLVRKSDIREVMVAVYE